MKQPGSLIWLLRELIQKASPSSFLLLIRLFSAYLNHKVLHMVSAHFRTPFTGICSSHCSSIHKQRGDLIGSNNFKNFTSKFD